MKGVPTAAERLLTRLQRAGGSVAVAESCTGGEVMAALTGHAGASDGVWGGAVVYAAEAKSSLVGLAAETTSETDPVVRGEFQTAQLMTVVRWGTYLGVYLFPMFGTNAAPADVSIQISYFASGYVGWSSALVSLLIETPS